MTDAPFPPTPLERRLWATPERRLLWAACAGPVGAVPPGLDERAFLSAALAHRVLPTVARSLADAHGVPDALRARLARRALRVARRQLGLAAAQARVLAALDGAGVAARPLKGPALSAWLFGDPARRHGGDLDVLVAPAALPAALAVLGAEGFAPEGPLAVGTAAEAAVATAELYAKDLLLVDRDRGVAVELHWALSRDLALPALSAALAPARGAGLGDPAAVAAHVLVHGAAHGYRRLLWLVDAAALAGRLTDDAWRRAWALARADGVATAFLLGPVLAERWLGVPVPGPLQAAVRARRGALGRRLRLLQTEAPAGVGRMRPSLFALEVLLHDRLADRARHVARYLARPHARDAPDLGAGRAAGLRRRIARPLRLTRHAARWAAGRR